MMDTKHIRQFRNHYADSSLRCATIRTTMVVRRLTPLECERLMGWPDDHTRYKADGTEQADTHRYKQCGNGVASPVAQWIGEQLINL
jgi:DNA (cytosine-5)-methyltransferase 1